MMQRWVRSACVGLCVAAGAGVAVAQAVSFAKPEDAIAYRKSAYQVMESHFSHLNAMALGRIPFDANAAAFDADTVAMVAKLPFQAFVPGSGPGPNTRANGFVWSAAPRFASDRDDFLAKAAKLPAAARAGNLDALKKAMVETGASCRKCHDQFRER